MTDLGRVLMLVGGGLFVMGAILLLAGRVPGLGQLPGDIRIQRGGFTLYAPVGTMLLLSILLTVVINLLARLWR